ncbi:RusA-like resolvase [Arthrobacter phage TaylorSipht]|nr:RusA-like resolvase [Arthrobacter phage TaylorSipht]
MSGGMVGFWVAGVPVPQGSKSIGKNRATGKATLYDANKALKGWRELVDFTARRAMRGLEALDEPCAVDMTFHMPRPAGHYLADGVTLKPGAPVWCAVKPDLDKLTRAIFDSLKTGGVWAEDSRAVILRTSMPYAALPHQAGVYVVVTPVRAEVSA